MKLNMKKIKLSRRTTIVIVTLIIFLSMLVLNFLTPLLADDYSYSFGLDGRINSFLDIINYQVNHYLTWGGRSIAHSIAQIFLLFPKEVFNVANAFIYTLLVYLIFMIVNRFKKASPLLMIVIHLLIWFIEPVFGQTCLWLIGSCNYLWTMVIMLSFIYVYLSKEKKEGSIALIFLMFLFGIVAGWTNENTSFGTITIILSLLIYKKYNKEKIYKWNISGLIGLIVGFLIMILSPGNFVRNNEFQDNTFIIIKLIKRALFATEGIIEYLLPALIILIILISIMLYKKKKINVKPLIFLIGAFFSIYSMCLSPTFPQRAWFGVVIFTIITIAYCINEIISLERFFKFMVVDLVLIYIIIFGGEYLETLRSINELRLIWNYRIETIELAKENDEDTVELTRYSTDNTHNPAYDLADLNESYKEWPNTSIEKYYNIKRIIGK